MQTRGRKVYIIESPSGDDFLNARKEGNALSGVLKLAGIWHSHFTVVNADALLKAIENIVTDIKENRFAFVFLHFTMHGIEEGIVLTDESIFPWDTLCEYIKWFNEKTGYMDVEWAPGIKYGAAHLCFSSCKGFNAKKMKKDLSKLPYTALLGPTEDIFFSDALIAFSVYYHNVIVKGYGWKHACYNMNVASGLSNIFQIDIADGLEPKGIPMV